MAWITLEAGLHPAVLARMRLTLKDVEHRVDGDAIQVPDSKEARRALGLMDELVACHTRILHFADPVKAKPYKPLERDVLYVALVGVLARHPHGRGRDFLADLLHSLVWAQPLPNTNHRSALSLVHQLAFPGGSGAPAIEEHRPLADGFIESSKPLVLEREFAPDPTRFQGEHARAARTYVDALVGQ